MITAPNKWSDPMCHAALIAIIMSRFSGHANVRPGLGFQKGRRPHEGLDAVTLDQGVTDAPALAAFDANPNCGNQLFSLQSLGFSKNPKRSKPLEDMADGAQKQGQKQT
jgi:hypothetical protein